MSSHLVRPVASTLLGAAMAISLVVGPAWAQDRAFPA
jgi:hypothetical protein